MHRRRAAEAERRHYIVDAEARLWRGRSHRLLIGGLIAIWFAGSIVVAYWLGEPYLRHHRNDVDPVQARLMADALDRKPAETSALAPSRPRDATDARIDALERRLADAVVRIDAIRSDGAATAFDEASRKQISDLKTQVAATNREIARLASATSSGQSDATNQSRVASVTFQPSSAKTSTVPESTVVAEARKAQVWAMGAVGLSIIANVLALWRFLIRRRPAVADSSTDEVSVGATVPVVTADEPDAAHDDEGCRATDASLSEPGRRDGKVDDDGAFATRMIAEMRNASIAGLDVREDEIEEEATSLVLIVEAKSPRADGRDRLNVVSENRLGVDFAVRISDGERAGLASQRIGHYPGRSVA